MAAWALLAAVLPAASAASAPSKANPIAQIASPWSGSSVNDLFREYGNIFKHGNRNAASHLWARFLLERSEQMTHQKFTYMFSGFCAVSGSPVRPSDYNRYKLSLDKVDGSGKAVGFLHYCCWPCVCDTQDFIRVDTRNVTTADGERTYRFAVIGNPCNHPEELSKPYEDAFGRGMSTLTRDAPEVRCKDGVLQDAPLSDHGHIIINMFFDAPEEVASDALALAARDASPQPGRITDVAGVKFQDEGEYANMCEERKRAGYNSGMGEIFRKVAGISPIVASDNVVRKLASDTAKPCPGSGEPGSNEVCK